jgi:hypothetical protein
VILKAKLLSNCGSCVYVKMSEKCLWKAVSFSVGVVSVSLLCWIGNNDGFGCLRMFLTVGQNCPCLGPCAIMFALFCWICAWTCLISVFICLFR